MVRDKISILANSTVFVACLSFDPLIMLGSQSDIHAIDEDYDLQSIDESVSFLKAYCIKHLASSIHFVF